MLDIVTCGVCPPFGVDGVLKLAAVLPRVLCSSFSSEFLPLQQSRRERILCQFPEEATTSLKLQSLPSKHKWVCLF